MYKVKVDSKGFNGVRAGIRFQMGEATFEDPKLVAVFKRLGYEVSESAPKILAKEKAPATKKAPAKKAPAKKAAAKKEE
ncbi:hypothetical protein [Alkalicoccobacillus gibsonii]|uniref:hypothetical protein n=1 Tax=Alkalicoccobacillus gibsonii TaxID=79881 RepID=UPI003517035F